MEIEKFVQNIKFYCAQKGVKPTVACTESGAGKDLINHLLRQRSSPSVDRVQLLAQYLGVTVSELLGEDLPPTAQASVGLTAEETELLFAWRRADEQARRIISVALEPFASGGSTSDAQAG